MFNLTLKSFILDDRTLKRVRDHEFDIPKRKEPKRKFDTVSTSRNALQKGTLGVRWERARRNDSKMLLTSKMGIDIDP
ncbi:hypothetical protein DPMN_048330 [Dreissena polymorpha]|uniref:Uncharacterized protein n=1 Tax=Dreissena polymorpha TaxID=45954 RepID=A0A9D4DB12_DREPO|nr:hypothetical protein DPMN_048330 [Dreissena polymorpha]